MVVIKIVKMSKEEIVERRKEMFRLRTEEHLTLQQIADKFGISRERVRQILGNTGRLDK